MATNSFNVKTWTITLVVATLLFKGNSIHALIAFIPLFSFWFLDSYYLKQERLFRKIHNWIVEYRPNNDDNLFNLDPTRFVNKVQSVLRIMFSVSTLPFYGGIFIMLISYLSVIFINYFECVKNFILICNGGQ